MAGYWVPGGDVWVHGVRFVAIAAMKAASRYVALSRCSIAARCGMLMEGWMAKSRWSLSEGERQAILRMIDRALFQLEGARVPSPVGAEIGLLVGLRQKFEGVDRVLVLEDVSGAYEERDRQRKLRASL